MKCQACGNEIAKGARYCSNCGLDPAAVQLHRMERYAVAAGVILGCSGYLAGAMYKYWPGPPYLPYLALVAAPPATILLVSLVAAIRDRLFPGHVRELLPSFSIAFTITYIISFNFYYFIRV